MSATNQTWFDAIVVKSFMDTKSICKVLIQDQRFGHSCTLFLSDSGDLTLWYESSTRPMEGHFENSIIKLCLILNQVAMSTLI